MQIGEFAKLCGTNISVLRYYDKIGLLSSAFTDVVTGYRYYAPGQERLFRAITMLGDAGFSLKEIGHVLENVGDEEALSAAFAAKQTEIAEMLRTLAEVQIYMKGMNEMEEEESYRRVEKRRLALRRLRYQLLRLRAGHAEIEKFHAP